MECGGESSLDVKEVTERDPKLEHKNRSPVIYDGVWETGISYHHVYDYFCKSWGINGDLNHFVLHYLGQSIDNDKNRVIAVAFPVRGQWQSGHKVHGQVFLPMIWYRQRLQVTIGLMFDCLQSQKNVTSSNINLDVSPKAQAIVFPADQLSCLVNTEMFCKKIIMVTTHHFGAHDLWDIQEPLILEHFLKIFSTLRKVLSSQRFCFFVVVSQLG